MSCLFSVQWQLSVCFTSQESKCHLFATSPLSPRHSALLLCANAARAQDAAPNANIAAEIPNTSADAEFATADKDGDGALSYVEFTAADQTCDLLTPGAIDQHDLNNDGQLSMGEIVAALQTEMVRASDSDSDGKNDADANGDGAVTHAELKQDSPLMAAMDMNRDGAVSASELIDVVAPTVAALDQDGNGKVRARGPHCSILGARLCVC